ncbi:hypothetical protein ACAX43_32585 [Paraburkholderia sp. IW21]|jgi:hypothetical protein|uniref:hypothetical protein n=1 Tax=Paraburkholderia sp. IW21 TaxID=3242488 RepID=UPI00352196E6
MRLIISSYLRTLKERDEFDRLLPDLVTAIGYTSIAKPQGGIRQLGVDLPVVGPNPKDGIDELLLFTIKQGDISHQNWDSGPQDVRQSLIEILDVYLLKNVEPAHENLRKRVVLATTGDLKQDTLQTWSAFVEKHAKEAVLEFWGGDKVAELVEQYMLDEHVFIDTDRTDLRKALAFAGERDYSMVDLTRMLLRQLGLDDGGHRLDSSKDGKPLAKAMIRLNLALEMFVKAAQDAGDTKQALIASELFILKAWHRIQCAERAQPKSVYEAFDRMMTTYFDAALHYYSKMAPYMTVRDGMSGYSHESTEYTIVLLEHVGLIASAGLAFALSGGLPDGQQIAGRIADGLCAMLQNMVATASPPLDENAIDVALALLLLVTTGRTSAAKKWLNELCWRLDFSFIRQMDFPISTDSLEDLVDFKVTPDEEMLPVLMGASWLTATLASWCAVLGMDKDYAQLSRGVAERYRTVTPQLWHPDLSSLNAWYFEAAHATTGSTEAPYPLPADPEALRNRMRSFLQIKERDVQAASPAAARDFYALDFIACRHYRTPVPARTWYELSAHQQPD